MQENVVIRFGNLSDIALDMITEEEFFLRIPPVSVDNGREYYSLYNPKVYFNFLSENC